MIAWDSEFHMHSIVSLEQNKTKIPIAFLAFLLQRYTTAEKEIEKEKEREKENKQRFRKSITVK